MKSLAICLILATGVLLANVPASPGGRPPAEETALGTFITQQIDKAATVGESARPVLLTPLRHYREDRECQVVILKTERGYHLWLLDRYPHDQAALPALEVRIHEDLEPGRPEYFDADGDGCQEIFITLKAQAADRDMTAFILLSCKHDSWKAFCPPFLAPVIRSQLGDIEPHEETFDGVIEFDGRRHSIQMISRGGWQVFERRKQKQFFAYVAVDKDELAGAHHRYAAVLYRFTGDGFEQVADWNRSKAFVTKAAVGHHQRLVLQRLSPQRISHLRCE